MTRNAAKAVRETGTTGLDDDKKGGSADGRKKRGVVEQKDNSTERTDTKGLDVNDGDKDVEEEGHNEGKLEHEVSVALPVMNEHEDGMDDSLAKQGGTEEELDSMVGNAMKSPEIRNTIQHRTHAAGKERRSQIAR